ncbi:signal peptidase I [Microbacterium sp.]|uniref:signal peptidase I n=1 Tax=unclassified Microbacterium TaxID=2609290 RepID=UPI0026167261|nr:signal peptidase I [Microbacterium sp.]
MTLSSPNPAPTPAPTPIPAPVGHLADRDRPLRWYVGRGLAYGLFAVVALVVAVVVVVPAVFGATAYTITGRSMEPALPVGTLIVTRPVDPAEIRTGDIITFQLESGQAEVATHRVIGAQSTADGTAAFVTRGDANDVADSTPVIADQIRGRLWYSVPLVGWVNYVLTGPVRAVMLPLAVAALCGYAVWMFYGAFRDRRRPAATPQDSPPEHTPV